MQAVNNEGKKILEHFSKELKVVFLYSIKTVVSHLKQKFMGIGLQSSCHLVKLRLEF